MHILKKHVKLIRVVLLAALLALVDQATKVMVYFHFSDGSMMRLSPFCDILVIWNYGISFGLFNNATSDQDFIILICLSIIAGLIYSTLTHKSQSGKTYTYLPPDLFAYAIIIGGASGNIMDRLRYGAVLDFIYLHLGRYYWPAFNLADSLIVLGAFILLYSSFKISAIKR